MCDKLEDSELYVCESCGCENIEGLTESWININTGAYVSEGDEGYVRFWCPDCDETTTRITKEEYDNERNC